MGEGCACVVVVGGGAGEWDELLARIMCPYLHYCTGKVRVRGKNRRTHPRKSEALE